MARSVSSKARAKTAKSGSRSASSRSASSKSASRRPTSKAASRSARKTTAKKKPRVAYTAADVKTLKSHSKARTPIKVIAREMKRTEGSLRQKAMALGIRLGHRR
jgi:hypothetical protein